MATEKRRRADGAKVRDKRAAGEGYIKQDPDQNGKPGRWRGAVVHGGVRRYVRGRTRKEVVEKLDELRAASAIGVVLGPGKLTVGAWMAVWLATKKPAPGLIVPVRPSTWLSYQALTQLHIIPALGSILLRDLQPEDVDRMLDAKREARLSPRRVAMIRTVLSMALREAVARRRVGRNAATEAKRVENERAKNARKRIEPLTESQARRFLDDPEVKADRLADLYLVGAFLGLRQGELCGLVWADIDWSESRLHVQRTAAVDLAGQRISNPPKTRHGDRVIRLPDVVFPALRRQRVRAAEQQLAAGPTWQDGGLVFPSEVGTMLDSRKVTKAFQAHLARLGLPRKRFHDLRHGAVVIMRAHGVEWDVIRDTMGHASSAFTMDVYGHVTDEQKRDAARALDEAWAGVGS
jgi:integrase